MLSLTATLVILDLVQTVLLENDEFAVVLRIGVQSLPPLQTVVWGPNGTFSCTGVGPEIYDWLAQYLRFHYQFVAVNDTEIARLGARAAAILPLMTAEVDIGTPGFELGAYSLLAHSLELSYPFGYSQTRLLTPIPGEEGRLWAVFRPFQPMVWLLLGVVLVIMPVLMAAFFYVSSIEVHNSPAKEFRRHFYHNVLYVLAMITNHRLIGRWSQRTIRNSLLLLVGVFLLTVTVLANSYAGTLKSALTVPKMKPSIRTINDLVSNQEITLAAPDNVEIIKQLLNAKSGVFRALGDQLRNHPQSLYRDEPQKRKLIASMRYALADQEIIVFYWIGLDYTKTKTCRYTASPPLLYSTYLSFGLRKGARYNQDLNKAIIALMQTGLMDHWWKRAMPNYQQCLNRKTTTEERPIKFEDYTSAFCVFGIGVGLSALVLSIEVAIHHFFAKTGTTIPI